MHDFLCYQRLEQTISGASKEEILQQLSSSVRDTICTDPTRWNEYVAKPLQIVTVPSSPFYEKFEKEVHLQLDAEIKNQHEDGYWEPNWSWFGHYEDTWKIAKIEWRGILTLQMLKAFKAFNKVDIN